MVHAISVAVGINVLVHVTDVKAQLFVYLLIESWAWTALDSIEVDEDLIDRKIEQEEREDCGNYND